MSKLALDHVERDALPGHLDSVGVAHLVWSEAPAYPGLGRTTSQRTRTCELDRGRPVAPLIPRKGGPTVPSPP